MLCNSLQFDLTACASDTLRNNLIACGDMNIPSSLVEPSAPTRYKSINNTDSTIDRMLIKTAPCFVRQSQWGLLFWTTPRGFFLLAFLTTGWCNAKLLLQLCRNQENRIPPIAYYRHPQFAFFCDNLVYETRIN